MGNIKIKLEVEDVLKRSKVEGNKLFLPEGQLERTLYTDVNKVIVNAGGKWDRKTKSHIFPEEPKKLFTFLETGVATDDKQIFQAFFTPSPLAAKVVELAEVNGKICLEPSAGHGALVKEMFAQGAKKVDILEINEDSLKVLRANFGQCYISGGDFMGWKRSMLYDRVVINPPFTKNQDVKHVLHAMSMLTNTGILVAIMANNQTRKPFVKLIEEIEGMGYDYFIEVVEAGAFKESGTMVSTLILKVVK